MKSDPLLPTYDPNRPVGDRIREELRTRREVDPIVRQKLGQVQRVRDQTFEQMDAEILANRRSGALSFVANEDRSPADAADVANLSRRFNLPSEVIAADPTIWRQRAKREDVATASAISTKLPQWTAKEQVRAAIITDDLDNLLRVEQALSPEHRARLKGQLAQRQQVRDVLANPDKATGGGNIVSSLFGLLGADTLSAQQESTTLGGGARSIGGSFANAADVAINAVGAGLSDLFGDDEASMRLSKINENFAILQAARKPEYSYVGGMVYDGFNSLALMAPGMAASIATRSAAPALASAYMLTAPEAYTRYRARGGTPGEAFIGANLEGIAEVGFEMLPMGVIVNRFGKEATGKWIGEYLVKEGLTEQATTFTQDFIDTAIANPDKTWGEFWAERPEAALRTLVATAVASGSIGALNTTANTIGGRMAQRQSRADAGMATAAFAENLQKLAQASKVRGRDVATFESWVREASDGTEAEAVYIEAQKLVEVLEQSGLDETQIIEALPSLQEALGEAMATNGDVRIPIEEFAARAEKLAPGLIPHLRIDPDDMSQAEAETYMQSAQESMAAEAEAIVTEASNADEFRASAERVKANVKAQLTSAGRFTESTNDAYASLHANFFARLAQRAGTTPEEMAARYPLQIQADVGQGVNVLEQQTGLRLFHGSPNAGMTQGDIRIIGGEGRKQGKKGRVYGGFYAADADRIGDAEGYAGEGGTVYEIALKPDAVVEEKDGDITRLSEATIAEYRERGVSVVKGKDPRGRTEYAIIDETAIVSFAPRGADPTVVNIGLKIDATGETMPVERAVAALEAAGVKLTRQEVRQSNTESTLIAALDRPLTPEEATRVSEALMQDAIAQRVGQAGELFGPKADDWGPFNPEYFLELAESGLLQQAARPPRPTVKSIAQGFTDAVKKKLYPEKNAKDYAKVLGGMRAEVAAQLKQENSGVGWYSKDVSASLDMAAAVFPTLADNAEHRTLYLNLAGIFSNGMDPEGAFMLAAEAFSAYLATGTLPVTRSEALAAVGAEPKQSSFKDKNGNQVNKPAGWSPRNATNEQQLSFVRYLIEREGSLGAALKWLDEPQPRTAINSAMTESGIYKSGRYTTKAEIGGPDTPGVLAFGQKLGRYTMGLLGHDIEAGDTTIDLWYIRTYRRLTGRLFETPFDSSTGIVGGPSEQDRKVIFRMTADLAKEFDLPPGDVQAVLWFSEKRLWGEKGLNSSEGTNTKGAARLLRSKGIAVPDDGARSDGTGGTYSQGAASQVTELESPPVDAEGYIELQHWAVEDDLATLDPSRWGRAGRFLPPEELSRTKVAPPRTYFGIATGQPGGYRNEFKEGSRSLVYGERYEYRARIKADRLYDMNADPLDLKAKGRALPKNQYGKYIYPNPQPMSNGALDGVSLYEQLIKDAGYDGYWIKNGSIGMVAAVFVPTEAERSTYNQDAPIFYSALARAVSTSKQAKAKASQWKGILQNAPGVKAEELEWSGLLDALDFDPDRVMTREELAEVVDKGGIVVDEVVLGVPNEDAVAERASQIEDDMWDSVWNGGSHFAEFEDGEWTVYGPSADTGDRFDNEADAQQAADDYNNQEETDARMDWYSDDAYMEAKRQIEAESDTQFSSWTSDESNDTYRELLMTLPIGSGGNPGRAPSTHWDQPNVVAHVRFMEKKDADGRRVLFIEEVQSDWHQKGRDQGYETKADPETVAAAQAKVAAAEVGVKEAYADFIPALLAVQKEVREGLPGVVQATFDEVYVTALWDEPNSSLWKDDALEAVQRWISLENIGAGYDAAAKYPEQHALWQALVQAQTVERLAGRELDVAKGLITNGGVPNAPFKSTWPALVMKRAIRWAVDNAYDKIAWTTGEQQAERYDLSKSLGSVVISFVGEDIRAPAGVDLYRVASGGADLGPMLAAQGNAVQDYNDAMMTEEQIIAAFGQDLGGRLVAGAKASIPNAETQKAEDEARAALDDISRRYSEAANREEAFKALEPELLAAEEALEAAIVGNRGTFLADGGDLKIGGEGMKAFYDRNLVNITNSLIKKYGAKVGAVGVVSDRNSETDTGEEAKARRELRALGESTGYGPEWEAARDAFVSLRANTRNAGQQQPGFDITPELATAASHGFPLFQRTGAPRGQISFGTDIKASPTTITLLRGADLSTFLHESGHFFLEVMADMAKLPDAPKEIVDDLNIFLRWSGVKDFTAWRQMSTQEKRDHHERFARAFEAYLYEGRAPSIEMQGLFGRFRSWLLNVYKSLANLNVEMTDEVRGVFDRMLASETQVQEAQAMAGMEPVYTAKPGTMTDAEWAAYQAAHMDATRDAAEELERRSLRDMRYAGNAAGRELKRLQKEVKAQRDAMRDEVTAEMAALPVYRAERYLRKGELDGETAAEQVKIQSSDLARRYEGKPELLEVAKRKMGGGKSGMLAKDGMTLDEAAEAFGFTSGDHFLDAYLGAQKFADAVETEIDARMVERYGDLNSPEALREAVDKAIHNDVRGRFVATEYAMLANAPGKPRALAAAARKVAQGVVARLRVRDVRPAQHEAAERRSGKAAADSAKKGNIAEAAAHKRSQLVSFFTAKAARDALDEVDKTLRYFRKFANEGTRKALDPAYRDQIDALLERFDLRASVTAKDAAKRASLLQWVERQREMGIEPVISEDLLNEAQRLPYKELTIEQMRGLADAIRNIEHIARLKKKLLTAKDEREFADIVDEVATGIENNAFKKVPETIGAKTWAERVGNGVKDFFAMHRKMANMAHVMDGNQYGGPVWERFIRAMNERGDWQATQNEKATIDLGKLFDRLKGQDTTRREFVPEINASISLEDRLMVALNLGNEANAQRLMDGDKWEQPQLNAVLAPLTQEHWDFVQATWDYINSFWPEIAAKELRVSGIAPEKVEATPFERQLEDGTTVSLRGGYFPIKYDPDRSSKAEADTAAEVLSQMTRGLYTAASTRRGHTKARAEKVERPLRKDFGVIFEHVNQVVHDLAWHEYLIDANRLLRAAPIDAAIREGYGPETLRWMRKALEDIAVGDIAAQNAFERAVNHLRAGVSVAGLGWNLWTSLLQPIGLTQSAARIGTKWVARGVMRLGGDAAKLENGAAWAYERSEMMRLRGKTFQREINEIRNQITSKSPLRKQVDKVVPAPVSQAVADSFFVLIAKAQMLADLPTWIGQYEKSLEAGQTEERAAALADQAVLDSQGGGQIKDLSGIQRGSPLIKLWTNFYSYFNVTYNLLSDRTQELKRVGPADLPYYAVDVLLLTALPSILTTLMFTALRGSDDDWEAEQLAKNIAKDGLNYGMGLMIGMREIGGALTGDAGYRGPAGARFFAEIANVGKQVEQGDVDEALFRSINNTAGILLHYPSGQVDRTVRGTQAMAEGEAGPLAPIVGPPRN